MANPGKEIRGSKRRGTHTTLIEAAGPLQKALRSIPDIGISPGLIKKKARSGSGRSLKLTLTDYGLQAQVSGGLYVQKLTIRCGTRERGATVFKQIEPTLSRSYNRVNGPKNK